MVLSNENVGNPIFDVHSQPPAPVGSISALLIIMDKYSTYRLFALSASRLKQINRIVCFNGQAAASLPKAFGTQGGAATLLFN